MKLRGFFWSAAWWRALLEGFAVCLLLFGAEALAVAHADEHYLGLSAVVVVFVGATLAGLRGRPVVAPPLRALCAELSLASLLAVAVGVICALVAARLGGAWALSSALGAFVAGGAYLFWRLFRPGWEALAHLRRRRFVWSLMFWLLLLTVAFIYLGELLLLALAALLTGAGLVQPGAPWGEAIFTSGTRLLFGLLVATPTAVFPALLVLLPPMALGAYWMTRRVSRRLTLLGETARRLSQGDLSARVQPEGEDEIAQLQHDFNTMASALERANQELVAERDRVAGLLRAQRELTAGVSHELRTPVATALAALESSTDHWDELPAETLRGDLQVARHEVERLQKLIEDLFTLSKAEISRLDLTMAPVEPAPLIERAVSAAVRLAWNAQRVRVTADLPEPVPPVLADATRLEQVLANLLNNGIRHTPPGGFVVVSAAVEGDMVRISVADTGEGIAAEDLPHIWERFYRGQSSASEARTGLGLAIVAELVASMGGRVGVESEPETGSTFSVWLKIAGSPSR